MDELKAIGVWLIEGLLLALGTLMWWLWRTDREEQNDRTEKLESRMGSIEANHLPRPEVERMVERIERDYKQEHASIIHAINTRHTELREDIAGLRDTVLNLIERRSGPRK